MCFYKRFYYLNHYQKGEKLSGMGIVKMVPIDSGKGAGRTSVHVDLSGCITMKYVQAKVVLVYASTDKLWGTLELVDGKGSAVLEELEDVIKGWEKICLRVCIGEDSYFACEVQGDGKSNWVKTQRYDDEEENIVKDSLEDIKDDTVEDRGKNDELEAAEVKLIPMEREKWSQLWAVWPHIKPFGDGREYLRLELGDLVILPWQYYRLVENSFLRHGYHNYGHLLLAKVFIRGQEKICIGVPGNYYEKEAQVAVMFGFESFESETEPAGEGDFGYYMISVNI